MYPIPVSPYHPVPGESITRHPWRDRRRFKNVIGSKLRKRRVDFSRKLSLTTNAEDAEDGVPVGDGSLSVSMQAQCWDVSSLSTFLILTEAGATIY